MDPMRSILVCSNVAGAENLMSQQVRCMPPKRIPQDIPQDIWAACEVSAFLGGVPRDCSLTLPTQPSKSDAADPLTLHPT
jgi:hypothetical protein